MMSLIDISKLPSALLIGDLILHGRYLYTKGERKAVIISELQSQALSFLWENKDRVVPLEEILHTIYYKPDIKKKRGSLFTIIRALQSRIGFDNGVFLERVHSNGFRLTILSQEDIQKRLQEREVRKYNSPGASLRTSQEPRLDSTAGCSEPPVIAIGSLQLKDKMLVNNDGVGVKLSYLQCAALNILNNHHGTIVTYKQIFDFCYNSNGPKGKRDPVVGIICGLKHRLTIFKNLAIKTFDGIGCKLDILSPPESKPLVPRRNIFENVQTSYEYAGYSLKEMILEKPDGTQIELSRSQHSMLFCLFKEKGNPVRKGDIIQSIFKGTPSRYTQDKMFQVVLEQLKIILKGTAITINSLSSQYYQISQINGEEATLKNSDTLYSIGKFKVLGKCLYTRDEEITKELSPSQMAALKLLVSKLNEIVGYDEIQSAIYNETGHLATRPTIIFTIQKLRLHLSTDSNLHLESVREQGLRLNLIQNSNLNNQVAPDALTFEKVHLSKFHLISADGTITSLTPLEYEILAYFFNRPGIPLEKKDCMKDIHCKSFTPVFVKVRKKLRLSGIQIQLVAKNTYCLKNDASPSFKVSPSRKIIPPSLIQICKLLEEGIRTKITNPAISEFHLRDITRALSKKFDTEMVAKARRKVVEMFKNAGIIKPSYLGNYYILKRNLPASFFAAGGNEASEIADENIDKVVTA